MKKFFLMFLTAVSALGSLIDSDRRATWTGNVGTQGTPASGRTNAGNVVTDFGADPTGVASSDTAFANANAACPYGTGKIQIPAGTFKLTAGFGNLPGVVFQGAGPGITIIKSSAQSAYVQTLNDAGNERLYNLYAPSTVVVTNGQTQISVTNTPSLLAVGLWFVLYESADGTMVNPIGDDGGPTDWTGPASVSIHSPSSTTDPIFNGQMCQVTAINNVTNITFSPPWFGFPLTNSLTPRIYCWNYGGGQNAYENFGLEDLTLENTSGSATYLINLHRAANGYFHNVELKNSFSAGFYLFEGSRIQMEDFWIHDTYVNTPGGGYGFEPQVATSACLLRNGIISGMRSPIEPEGGQGNVWIDIFCYGQTNYDATLQKCPGFHACYPNMNLCEGIIGQRMGADNTHGANGWNTFFRCWGQATNIAQASPASTQMRRAVDIGRYSRNNNVVGCVLGYFGVTPTYNRKSSPTNRVDSQIGIWDSGYAEDNDGGVGNNQIFPTDTAAYASQEDHANYDVFSNSVTVDGIHDTTIPASLFYTSAPYYWKTNLAWPSIGPKTNDYTTLIYSTASTLKIPAQITYEDMIANNLSAPNWGSYGGGSPNGCSYSPDSTTASADANGIVMVGSTTVNIIAGAGCAWTSVANVGWLHVTSGSSVTGSGSMTYTVDANTGTGRSGTMTIAGYTFTVTQDPPAGAVIHARPGKGRRR